MGELISEPADGDRWLKWYREAKTGNKAAEAQLFHQVRPFFLAVVKKRSEGQLSAIADASDVAQDICLKLTNLPTGREFRGSTGQEFVKWLRKIAKHEFLDAIRASKTRKRGGCQPIGRLPGDSNGDVAIAADTSTPS